MITHISFLFGKDFGLLIDLKKNLNKQKKKIAQHLLAVIVIKQAAEVLEKCSEDNTYLRTNN